MIFHPKSGCKLNGLLRTKQAENPKARVNAISTV